MHDPHSIATTTLAAWNATDAADRARCLATWAVDAHYQDPLMQGDGREGIAAMMAGTCARFPGHRFELAGTPDGHGPFVRFMWRLVPAGGTPVAQGTDVVRLDWDGRIVEVIGFLDAAPGAQPPAETTP